MDDTDDTEAASHGAGGSPYKPSPVPREAHEDTTEEEPVEDASARRDSSGATETVDDAEGPASAGTRRGRGAKRALRTLARVRVLVPLLLITALTAGCALLGVQYLNEDAVRDARDSAKRAAREYAVALTTYDHTSLRDDFGRVSSHATGEFAKEYEQVSANLTKLIKKHESTSEGNVIATGTVSVARDRAVVLLFVDQTIKNANIDKPRIDRNRMRMTLVREGERWLVDNVELL